MALVSPRQPCMATSMVRGPCHDCICTVEGLYHCREVPCRENITEQIFVTQCQPSQVYQVGNIICECTSFGRWRSESCQNVFKFMQTRFERSQNKLRARVVCEPEGLYVIGCNVCICPKTGHINEAKCSNRRCVKTTAQCQFGDLVRTDDQFCTCNNANVFGEDTCVKIGNKHIQPVRQGKIAKLINLESSWLLNECVPGEKYWIDCNNCNCDRFGSLECSNNDCVLPELDDEITFRMKNSNYLPELKDENQKCTPGNTYRVHCNTCVCSASGKLHCTTMVCWEQLVDSIEPL